MNHDNDHTQFQSILAAIGERELTEWERERLWELLEADPERISVFTDHCFLGADLGEISDEQLEVAGIAPRIRNIVSMPGGDRTIETVRPFPIRRVLVGAAAVAAAIMVSLFLVRWIRKRPFRRW